MRKLSRDEKTEVDNKLYERFKCRIMSRGVSQKEFDNLLRMTSHWTREWLAVLLSRHQFSLLTHDGHVIPFFMSSYTSCDYRAEYELRRPDGSVISEFKSVFFAKTT